MIPTHLIPVIGLRLDSTIGWREDVGDFVFRFAALPSGHDLEYALEELEKGDAGYKKAVNIVLEEVSR